MLEHVDEARGNEPRYQSSTDRLGAALSTTRRVSKLEKFGFISEGSTHGQDSPSCGNYCSKASQERWTDAKETLA